MKKPAAKKVRKPKRRSPGPRSKEAYHVILSFTVPPELEGPMNAAAALRGMSRSAYIVWLVRRDLNLQPGLPEPPQQPTPPRVRR